MKVNISHSIELEDLPQKAAELLMPAETRLKNALRWLDVLVRDLDGKVIDTKMAVVSLDRIRRSLGTCDNVLTEVENIMQAVLEYEQRQDLPPSPAPPPQPDNGFNRMVEEMEREKESLNEP